MTFFGIFFLACGAIYLYHIINRDLPVRQCLWDIMAASGTICLGWMIIYGYLP